MLKKLITLSLASLMAVSMLAGCGTTPAPAQPPAQGAAPQAPTATETTTVKFWVRTADKFENEIAAFEAANPTIKVELLGVGKDYDELVTKYMAGIAANDLPNVAMLGQRHGIPQLYDSGKLLAIESFMTTDEQNDILPAFWERFTYKGKRVAVPFQSSMPIMFYNKAVLSEMGITEVPDTFDKLVLAAKTAASSGKYFGFNMHSDSPWYVQPLAVNYGQPAINADGTVNVKQDGYKKVFEAIQTMVHTDKSMPGNQHNTAREDFNNGLTAFHLDSCASWSAIEKGVGGKFEVGIAYFPKSDLLSVPIGGNSLGIFQSDPATEAASFKLVQYLISPESIVSETMEKGYIPISTSSLEDDTVKAKLEDPLFKTVIGQVEYLRGQPVNPADSIIWSNTISVLEKVEANPKTDIDAELAKFQESVDKFLGDYKK